MDEIRSAMDEVARIWGELEASRQELANETVDPWYENAIWGVKKLHNKLERELQKVTQQVDNEN